MSSRDLSGANLTLHREPVNPSNRLQCNTGSDAEAGRLWLQLCLVISKGHSEAILKWLEASYSHQGAPTPDELPEESQAIATGLLTQLRVAQRYWGIGVTAGKNLSEIGLWAGNLKTPVTALVLSHLTHLFRERGPSLESELFLHATAQATSRIDTWLDSVSYREADVLAKRYGLRGQSSATLAKVGQMYGVSSERVRQIESRALRRLGHAVADELGAAYVAGSRPEALHRAFRSLSTRPGEDVHCVDELLKLASFDEDWWPCGIAILARDVCGSTARADRRMAREWLTDKADVIWLDSGMNFMRRRSENKSTYVTTARKLLAIHETVPIRVVHEAVIETWRSELWPECMLSVEWLGAFLRESMLNMEGNYLVRSGEGPFSHELSQSEQKLLGALQELGGLASLGELRERLPELRRQGTTLSQTLYGRTPIVQHIGPSIFGIRGAVHDPNRVAFLEDRALTRGHPWVNRGGWEKNARHSLRYRIPSRNARPTRIRIPNKVAEALLGDNGRSGPLILRTPDGIDHSVGVHSVSSGTYLTGVRPVLSRLQVSGGDTINMTQSSDDVWTVAPVAEAPPESVVIRMGRGWTSVAF